MTLKASDVITEEVVRNVTEDIAEENLQFREAFRSLSATNINSNTYKLVLPKDDLGEPQVIGEGEEFPLDEHENQKLDIEFDKYGFSTMLTMESVEDSMLDVRADQVEQRARQLRENMDRRAFDTLQNNNGGVYTDTSADGVFDFADVVSGLTAMQDSNYNPDALMVEPTAVGDLMLDEQFTDAASDEGHQAVREGVVGQVAGVDVLVANSQDISEPGFDDTSNPGGILVDTDFYGYEITRTPITSEEYEKPERQADVIQTYTRKDWTSVYDDAAVFIEG